MALGTPTLVRKVKTAPIFVDELTFAGDGAYPAGGTAAFSDYFKAALEAAGAHSAGREILAVHQTDALGYVLRYDDANDKLKVLTSNGAAPAALLDFTNGGNLSASTFKVIVISK